jgi:hypothetical protein
VGVNIKPYKDFLELVSSAILAFSFKIPDKMGRPNPNVFPLPVSATPTISLQPGISTYNVYSAQLLNL